jgi:hypothetical protein
MAQTTSKEFTVVGISKHNGEYKVRYAKGLNRKAVLERNGHTDVQLFQMPFSGYKNDAVDCLLNYIDQLPEAAQAVVRNEAAEFGFIL